MRSGRSLSDWLGATLVRIEHEHGFARSSLLLVIEAPTPGTRRAFAGADRGEDQRVLSEYFARWAASDPLASEVARMMYDTRGWASTRLLYPDLDTAGRRFVDQFLKAAGIADQLSIRLAGNGTTNAYLTVHESEVIGEERRAGLVSVQPELTRQLRAFLPRGLPGSLSLRERQAAELVAFGLTNRQIGQALGVGPDTVKKHLYRAMLKLGLKRRTQLAVSWMTGRQIALR